MHGVESGLAQRSDHVWEMGRVDRAHVKADRALVRLLEAQCDRAGDLVAWGELVDEALAGEVVQGCALAADRLGDQKSLPPGEADHGGGVELQQLEICQRRAGGMGEQQADSLGAGWVGGARPQRRGAARAEHDRAGGDDPSVVTDQAATAGVRWWLGGGMGGLLISPQRSCSGALEHGDEGLLGNERRELAHEPATCRGASGVHDAPDRMTALQAERQGSGAVAVEADSQRLQVFHACGRLAHEDLGRRASDERTSGTFGVGQVQLEAVIGGECCGEPALRPVGGGLGQTCGRDEHHPGAIARRAESGVESCCAGTHYRDVGLEHWTGLSGAHRFVVGVKSGFEVGGVTLEEVWPGGLALGVVRRGVVVAPVWLPAPGAVVLPGVVAPGTAVVVVGVVLAPEVVVVVRGRVVAGGTAVVGGTIAAGAVVTVVVEGAVVEVLEPPASVTSAAASTPSDSAARAASARTGAFQAGDAARRVRAAAPQRRHHSCSISSGALHSGHISRAGAGATVVAGGMGVATLTRQGREDGRSRWVDPAQAPAKRPVTERLSAGRRPPVEQ